MAPIRAIMQAGVQLSWPSRWLFSHCCQRHAIQHETWGFTCADPWKGNNGNKLEGPSDRSEKPHSPFIMIYHGRSARGAEGMVTEQVLPCAGTRLQESGDL